jgi:hypothetical protein
MLGDAFLGEGEGEYENLSYAHSECLCRDSIEREKRTPYRFSCLLLCRLVFALLS